MPALFGCPGAGQDDVERATYPAPGIVETMPALRIPRHEELRLSVRIGRATGLVIAGDVIGDGPSREEAILGETPNLAAAG